MREMVFFHNPDGGCSVKTNHYKILILPCIMPSFLSRNKCSLAYVFHDYSVPISEDESHRIKTSVKIDSDR